MRQRFINFLLYLLKMQHIEILILENKEYTTQVIKRMRQWEKTKGASGEWKAHQVIAALVKDFPAIPKADLRLEIELCYQRFFKEKE